MDRDLLIRRLEVVIDQLDEMHEATIAFATQQGIPPGRIQTTSGEFMLTPIFIAQADALAALANLKYPHG